MLAKPDLRSAAGKRCGNELSQWKMALLIKGVFNNEYLSIKMSVLKSINAFKLFKCSTFQTSYCFTDETTSRKENKSMDYKAKNTNKSNVPI